MKEFSGFGISPSILSADFASLGDDIKSVEEGGAVCVHVDVMDGHFVPNITIGPPVVKSIKNVTDLPLDVHLMIENPDNYICDFVEAGADLIAVHVEASRHLHRTLSLIKDGGVFAGVALNPSTKVDSISEIATLLDFVVIMSVNPGFGGQKFIPESLDKVLKMRTFLDRKGLKNVFIEVDGGVNAENIKILSDAGASLFVAGSSVYGKPDSAEAVRSLLEAVKGH